MDDTKKLLGGIVLKNGKSKLGELALFCYVLWQGLER